MKVKESGENKHARRYNRQNIVLLTLLFVLLMGLFWQFQYSRELRKRPHTLERIEVYNLPGCIAAFGRDQRVKIETKSGMVWLVRTDDTVDLYKEGDVLRELFGVPRFSVDYGGYVISGDRSFRPVFEEARDEFTEMCTRWLRNYYVAPRE